MKDIRTSLKSVLQIAILVSLTFFTLFVLTLTISHAARKAVQPKPHNTVECPPPTVENKARCILTQDEALDAAIELSSNMILDCRGHRLTPSAQGQEAEGENPSIPSVPVAAIFLNDVAGVIVKNCVIADFDFGIVAVNDGKMESLSKSQRVKKRNIISGNTVRTLYNGINIIKSDQIEIRDNTITTKGSAAVIQSLLDSDSIHIHDNKVTATKPGFFEGVAPYYPGSPDFFNFADGIAFGQMPAESIDVIVGDTVVTFVDDSSQNAIGSIVEDNIIDLTVTDGTAGVYVSVYQDGLIIRVNTFKGGGSYGVALSPFLYTDVFPDPSTWARDVVVENNNMAVGGHFSWGPVISRNVFNPIIRGNKMEGGESAGISLYGKSIETATLSGNIIKNNVAGIELDVSPPEFFGPPPQFFGAKIFLNDIAKNTNAISIFPDGTDYSFPSEFSVNGKGNFWGHRCSEDGGFIEAGKPNADSPDPDIFDNHPYGEPVAGISHDGDSESDSESDGHHNNDDDSDDDSDSEDLPMTCF